VYVIAGAFRLLPAGTQPFPNRHHHPWAPAYLRRLRGQLNAKKLYTVFMSFRISKAQPS
jgi:hypothetical protein